MSDPFAATARGRRAVADLLDGLDEARLGTPSLCAGWSVKVVAGHLAAAVTKPTRAFLRELLRQRGNGHATNTVLARKLAELPASELAGLLREHADRQSSPPVVGPRGPLADVRVHGGDMRLPLGLPHTPEPADVRPALEFVTTGRPVGFVPRGALHGLRLVATDLDEAWGAGEELSGRAVDILMAACGRTAVLPSLTGAGIAVLAGRLTTRR
jgi:uncharacterized protein (TIGR03083 family)